MMNEHYHCGENVATQAAAVSTPVTEVTNVTETVVEEKKEEKKQEEDEVLKDLLDGIDI